ncbi:MAG: hypothetical protein H6727_15860 [Myxococcales bacterium]|nr:hypothetical protein [Myxococcales bacterium]
MQQNFFRLGAINLASCWEPMIHPAIRSLSFPPVPQVDCNNCRMVNAHLFPPHVKCCSRMPDLPNFLIGSLLVNGPETHGKQVVIDWISDRRTDPLYALVPPQRRQEESGLHSFKEWPVCPMHQDGGCSIYAHRPYVCMGYHCFFPDPPELYAFWNSLSTLLALISVCASQYLALQCGLVSENFRDAWGAFPDDETAWPNGQQMDPQLHQQLWDSLDEPKAFYQHCYQYILDHQDTILDELDQFRREQLVRFMGFEGHPDPQRAEKIKQQPKDPSPQGPDPEDHKRYMKELILGPDKHRWTFREIEGHILYYYQRVFQPNTPSLPA